MTTGGRLAEIAGENNIPVFKIEYKAQPRAALGFSFVPTLGVLQKLGLLSETFELTTQTSNQSLALILLHNLILEIIQIT